MTIRAYDANGRPVVRLSGADRAVVGCLFAAVLGIGGWTANELIAMRDQNKSLAQYRIQDRHDIDDHESRLRSVERRP